MSRGMSFYLRCRFSGWWYWLFNSGFCLAAFLCCCCDDLMDRSCRTTVHVNCQPKMSSKAPMLSPSAGQLPSSSSCNRMRTGQWLRLSLFHRHSVEAALHLELSRGHNRCGSHQDELRRKYRLDSRPKLHATVQILAVNAIPTGLTAAQRCVVLQRLLI